jgi:hypothetical protein
MLVETGRVVSSQDQRRSMNQRRQATAQQIRKQRREEVRSKRQANVALEQLVIVRDSTQLYPRLGFLSTGRKWREPRPATTSASIYICRLVQRFCNA